MKDFILGSTMSAYRIVALPGDGTGREVMREALKVLDVIQEHGPVDFDIREIPCGGQHYLETGEQWPEGSFEICRDQSDAILLGAIGWPDARLPNGDVAGGEVILGLRSGLDLYANVRPVKLYEGILHKVHGKHKKVWDSSLVDLVMVRENTEGLYHSLLRRMAQSAIGERDEKLVIEKFPGLEGEVKWDPRPISRTGSERIHRFCFDLAERRAKKLGKAQSVTCVDKSNVLRGCQLFRAIFREMSDQYPSIDAKEAYIDAFTMWLVRDPEDLDVVVLPNMFGDIATDLASVLQGGMGMAASANLGDRHMMFEPVHGSAPKHAGKNIVNPIAMLSSLQLMLENLAIRHSDESLDVCGSILQRAISELLSSDGPKTYDIGGSATTSEVGDAVVSRVQGLLKSEFS